MNFKTLYKFYNYIINNNLDLPIESNSFYNVSNGIINLFINKDNKYDLYTDEGNFITGDENINIDNNKFNSFTIIKDTELLVNRNFIINNNIFNIHGILILEENSILEIKNNSKVIFYSDSKLIIKNNAKIIIDNSNISIYGKINSHLSNIDTLLDNDNIYIDSATLFEIDGIDTSNRQFSLSDYEVSLRNHEINKNTQGEYDAGDFRYTYSWKKSYGENNNLLELSVDKGNGVLGDFKFSVLGIPNKLENNKQMISELNIEENGELYIIDNYKNSKYINPNLYIGIEIGNNITPGNCNINGLLTVSGKNSFIALDRKGTLHINHSGVLVLENNSKLISTNNENTNVLFINGCLVIDNIEQLVGFNKDNIIFGEDGKLIILNKYTERKLLWTTPNGIKESYLYKLFKDRLDKIEYHICENTGIGIDQYYIYYEREFTDWYNGMRFEKAIKEGYIIFDNGFIELDHKIIPWITLNCNLYDASRIFKNNSTSDRKNRLQQVVDNLKYAGCGNIVFRFIDKDKYKEYTLHLDDIKIKNIINKPLQTNYYILTTNNDGQLFINNNIDEISHNSIINENSLKFDLQKGNTTIEIND